MTRKRLLVLLVTILLASCSKEPDSDTGIALPESSLPGVYSGVFPCEGCPGIAATLWLRPDGRFFFQQRYPADATREEMDVYGLGRWRIADEDRAIRVTGSGPERTFVRLDHDTLLMQTESDLEHRLTRDPSATEFSASIRMEGTMSMRGGSVFFTECLTGFAAPVSKGGDFAKFRHQYRSVGGEKKPTYVEFEGRFLWSGDGAPQSVTIERFITVKEKGSC